MSLRALFTENLRQKALSLLFAAVLCLFVALEAKDEVEIPLQANFVNLPPGLALKESIEGNLTARVAGSRILLIKQQMAGIPVRFDLSGAAAGKVSFSLLERHLKVHPGVTLLRVSPATVEIVLTRVGKTGQSN